MKRMRKTKMTDLLVALRAIRGWLVPSAVFVLTIIPASATPSRYEILAACQALQAKGVGQIDKARNDPDAFGSDYEEESTKDFTVARLCNNAAYTEHFNADNQYAVAIYQHKSHYAWKSILQGAIRLYVSCASDFGGTVLGETCAAQRTDALLDEKNWSK